MTSCQCKYIEGGLMLLKLWDKQQPLYNWVSFFLIVTSDVAASCRESCKSKTVWPPVSNRAYLLEKTSTQQLVPKSCPTATVTHEEDFAYCKLCHCPTDQDLDNRHCRRFRSKLVFNSGSDHGSHTSDTFAAALADRWPAKYTRKAWNDCSSSAVS